MRWKAKKNSKNFVDFDYEWPLGTFLSFSPRYHYSPLNFESKVISRFSPTRSFLRAEIMLLQHKAHVFKPSTWTLFNIQWPWNVFLICDCLHQTDWLPGPYSRIITTIQWLEAALLSLPFLSLNHLPNLVCSRQGVWFYFCFRIYKDIISLYLC